MSDIILDKDKEEEYDNIVQEWQDKAEQLKQVKKSKYEEVKEKLK